MRLSSVAYLIFFALLFGALMGVGWVALDMSSTIRGYPMKLLVVVGVSLLPLALVKRNRRTSIGFDCIWVCTCCIAFFLGLLFTGIVFGLRGIS